MAGDRKKQKRKKSWRTVLEGCFNRSPFGGGSGVGKRFFAGKKNGSTVQKNKTNVSPVTLPTSRTCDERPTELHLDRLPLRGILKKSPTVSSLNSVIYAEAAVDVPQSPPNSSPEWPQTRTAYLLHNGSTSLVCKQNTKDVQQKTYSKNKSDDEDKTLKRQHNSSFHPSLHSRKGYNDKFNDKWDDNCNQSYDIYKTQNYKCNNRNSLAVSRNEDKHMCNNKTKSTRWSYPQYDPDDSYSQSFSHLCQFPLVRGQRSSQEEPYIPVSEMQDYVDHKQRRFLYAQHHPLSVTSTSWQQEFTSRDHDTKHYLVPAVLSSNSHEYTFSPRESLRDLEFCHDADFRSKRNSYCTSALPRSRDPIRKPMGSLYCPYSNSLYKAASVSEMDGYSTGHTSFHGKHAHPSGDVNDGKRHSCVNVPSQTVEVSQIYATVTRSSTKSTSTSYIYASISWKSSRDTRKSHQSETSPDIPFPSMPPKLWEDAAQLGQLTSQLANQRPPLPSYEEVIESRIGYGSRRPVSWSESSHLQETERKREAFMQLLAQRYPQYADRIQSAVSHSTPVPHLPDKPSRSREGQRRRTALVTYNPNVTANSLEYDDIGTMNDLEVSSFQRGGFSRTSLPIVRSASTSLERPLGLVFLVYGDQTKKALLPNEITTLDTVRALFVRAFPDLTLESLENHRKKIYLLDPATSIYFQLEDLTDIKDRSVLKIHETDNDQPQKVKERQEVRGRTVQMAAAKSLSGQNYGEVPLSHNEMLIKSQSLVPHHSNNYQEMMQEQRNQWERERRSRSRTPEPADRSQRSLSAGSSAKQRFSHSPDRLPTPDRLHLNPIPENRQIPLGHVQQGNYYENVGPGVYRGHYPSGIYESPVSYQGYPSASHIPSQQTYVACSMRASSMTYPQRAVIPGLDMNAGFQRSQSYRIPPTDRDGKDLTRSHSVTPVDDTARNRIEKMEQQLASLTAWVHYQKDSTRQEVIPAPRSLARTASDSSDTFPASSASKHKGGTTPISTIATSTNHVVHSQGLSDIHDGSSGQRSSGLSSRESTPISTQAEISLKLAQLKSDLHVLRKQQLHNMEVMKDEFSATLSKIKKVILSRSEAENEKNFQKQTKATITKSSYISDKQQVDKDLGDLEASVEELRTDIISKQCRVNTADVESIAFLLNSATKSIADLKARFSEIHGQMKHVLDDELNVLVSEEKFLKEEPLKIENSMKRCKNISDSLSYIRRLKTTQDQSLPHGLSSSPVQNLVSEKKQAFHDKDEALMPDHNKKVIEKEAAFERKEQVNFLQGALKLDKRVEIDSQNTQQHLHAVTDSNGEKVERRKGTFSGSIQQFSQEKPNAPVKPVISSNATTTSTHSQSAAIIQVSVAATSQVSPAATTSTPSTSAASYGKVSFSTSSATAKSSEKPTATVSAMTSGISDTVTTTVIKAAVKESSPPEMRNVFMPLTQTTERLVSTSLGGSDNGTVSPKDVAKSPKKKDTTVYTYQVCGPVNPVFPIPPVTSKSENIDGTPNSKTSPTEIKDKITSIYLEKTPLKSCNKDTNKPPDLAVSRTESVKKGSVSFSEPPVTNIVPSSDHSSSVNGHYTEKVDHTVQKQTARSAFFNSFNTSPNRHSVSLDHGPVLSPTGLVGKMEQIPTINLVLTGTVSPMSPTSPGSFNISSPLEISFVHPENVSSSNTNSPAQGIPNPNMDKSSSSNDSQSSTLSDSSNKQKKVPPPPPPRQSSRPTSSPVNGIPPDLSNQQMREMPRFVGGILGQHRLSEPVYSTSKSILRQQEGRDANTLNITNTEQRSSALENDDHGSSSESSISSSSTVGSQQSVATVVRSSSVTVKDLNKSKPDPPKRHSSLLMKLTSSKESKSKIKNGKATKVNGVDF